ncbi:hypothetical protein ACQKNX_22585 [Lysinibacillus sp. NPDC093712]|uniref:hypothetical protein n=1 Tax=Lysinibacillus sp. NPDC093712 TaxID=3390579 RepID=UPI003D0477F0
MTTQFDDLFSMFNEKEDDSSIIPNQETENTIDITDVNSSTTSKIVVEDEINKEKTGESVQDLKYEVMIISDNSVSNNCSSSSTAKEPPTTFEELSAQLDAQVEKAEANEKLKKENSNSNPLKTKADDFDINQDTIIRYFRELIPITNYFTLDEITNGIKKKKKDYTFEFKKIDGEMVRQRMEKEFPELVKDYTEMKYIGKDKNFIIPVTIAKKKGCSSEVKIKVESSFDDSTSFIFPSKIPFKLLLEFINLARVYAEHKLEVRGEFYYNFDTDSFLLHIPKQTVSYHLVISNEETGYFEIQQLEKNGHFVQLACEIHSHHVLRPLPSNIDNQSERKPGMFYIIVGTFHKSYLPEIYIRTFQTIGDIEQHVQCELSDVFVDDKTTVTFKGLPSDYKMKNLIINNI